MGRLFIENENDFDITTNFYCKLCEDLKIEISPVSKMLSTECETVGETCIILAEINTTNILVNHTLKKCDLHPNTDYSFIILDTDPIVPQGYVKEISCKGCLDILGWYCAYHTQHKNFIGLFFIKKSKVA